MHLDKILEEHHWRRDIAGDHDFDAAIAALEKMLETGKGLIVSGGYGAGKTSFCEVLCEVLKPYVRRFNLALEPELEKLTPEYQEYFAFNPFEEHVFLDDLGSEKTVNEYGIRSEIAADFISKYHYLKNPERRLIISTNLTTAELDERYGGRVLSRLKDLCVPLRFTGKDKRQWTRRVKSEK